MRWDPQYHIQLTHRLQAVCVAVPRGRQETEESVWRARTAS